MSLKVFNIFSNSGNADSNFFEISSYPSQEGEDQEHRGQQMPERIWGKGILVYHLWDCRLVQLLWKSMWGRLKKLNFRTTL